MQSRNCRKLVAGKYKWPLCYFLSLCLGCLLGNVRTYSSTRFVGVTTEHGDSSVCSARFPYVTDLVVFGFPICLAGICL